MAYIQSLAIWLAMKSIVNGNSEHWVPGEANRSQPEEVFVPFNLPPLKPEPTEEATLPVAVPAFSSEAKPIGV